MGFGASLEVEPHRGNPVVCTQSPDSEYGFAREHEMDPLRSCTLDGEYGTLVYPESLDDPLQCCNLDEENGPLGCPESLDPYLEHISEKWDHCVVVETMKLCAHCTDVDQRVE